MHVKSVELKRPPWSDVVVRRDCGECFEEVGEKGLLESFPYVRIDSSERTCGGPVLGSRRDLTVNFRNQYVTVYLMEAPTEMNNYSNVILARDIIDELRLSMTENSHHLRGDQRAVPARKKFCS
ncbi:hypothetical protein TNCV_1488281 [Trichonephila clavipes]|nr:hypothetical protein TNCV_1488281 [Trichonephila clavipes]